jgi:hypothetical protein
MIVGGIIARQTSRHDAATMTSTAKATIVDSSTQRRSDNNDRPRATYSCAFTYRFDVEGRTFTGHDEDKKRCSGKQRSGTERTVYYDPESPKHSAAHDPVKHTHWWIILEVVGVVCLAWGGGSIWFRRYLSRLDRRGSGG